MNRFRFLPAASILVVGALTAHPGIQAPRLTATMTNKAIVFSTARLNPIQFDGTLVTNDVIALVVTNGTLTLAATNGLTFTVGDGTSDVMLSFSGAITNVNVALDGLRYQPATNAIGRDAISVSISGSQSTNKSVLITLSPWLDLTAAQTAILAGVGTNLSSSLAYGSRLVPFGRTAGGLFYRTGSGVWWENNPYMAMAAAANWGNGRLVVVQKGATNWGAIATSSDTTNFLNQAVRWASRTSGAAAVVKSGLSSTVTWLQGQGYSATLSTNWWTNLTGVNLVIVSGAEVNDWTTKSNALTALRNLALAGGGVILHGDSTCADEVFDTGIFDSGTNPDYWSDGFTSVPRPPQDSGILQVLDRASDPSFSSDAKMIAGKELDEFDRHYTVLSAENYNQVRGEILAFNMANLQPTPATPMSDSWGLRLLNEENTYLQSLPAAQTPKFRTADTVYGAITPSVPRVRDWVLVEAQSSVPWQQPYSTGRIRKRQPTGLYAPPGEVVTVRFPADVVGKGLQVMVGNNPGLVDYGSAKELPYNLRYFTVTSPETPVANAMGGAIMIQVPDHWALGSFNVEIIGAVRHPYFRLGRHTNTDWVSEIRSRIPNCLIIEGDRFYNMLGAEFARNIDDMEGVARYWEDTFIWFDWQRGWERSPFKPQPFPLEQYATLSTIWGFNSGITANFSYDNWDSLIATNVLWTGYNGYHHESGHSHENEFYATTGARPWYPDGDGETYANVLPFAPIVHMGINGPGTDGHNTIPMQRRTAFNSAWTQLVWDGTGYDWATQNGSYTDNGGRMGFWAILGQEFNWRYFPQMCLAGQTNTASMSQIQGNDWRLSFLSQYFGRDLSAYFTFLGVTNSAAGIAAVTNLPSWKPICGTLESSNTPLNTALTINFALATNVYSLDGVATLASVTQPRHGTVSPNGSGSATYTPTTGFQGYDAFVFTLQSSTGDKSVQEFVVTVGTPGAANTRPFAAPDTNSTTMSTPVTINVLANDTDADGDALYLWRVECPLYGIAVTNGAGGIVYTPDADFYGTDQFTYVIHDGRGGEHRARVFVNVVNSTNRVPTLTSIALSKKDASVGTPYRDSLSANATDADAWDKLIFSKTAGPAWLTVNPDGSLGGQPGTSNLGTNTFTLLISDDRGASTNATLPIVVRDLFNYTGMAGWWKFDENTGTSAADATGHGFNGTLESAVWTNGQYGAAVYMDGSTADVLVPALNLNTNTVTITAWVRRNGTQSSYAGVVFCRGGNTVAGLDVGSASELRYHWNDTSSSYNFNSGLVLPDGQWAFAALVVEPTRAVFYLGTNGVFRSATNTTPHAIEEFDGNTLIGEDSTGGRQFKGALDEVRIYNVSLTQAQLSQVYSNAALAVEHAPVFTNSIFSLAVASEGLPYNASIAGSATDSDGDTLTYSKIGGPAWLAVSAVGVISGTAPASYGGTNLLYVEVSDGKGGSDVATVQVPVNGKPYFLTDPLGKLPAQPAVAYSSTIAADAADPNPGDTLSFSKVAGPAWLNVATSGALSGTPTTGDIGMNSFTVQATDPGGLFATATLNIFVNTNPPLAWTGGATNNFWNIASNWNTALPTNNQSLLFLGTTRQSNTNNLLTSVGQVIFQNDGFTLSGNLVTLRGGMLNLAGDNTWAIDSTFASAQTFISSNGLLTVSGALTNAGFNLTNEGVGNITLSGMLSGSGKLIKNGGGTLTMEGNKNFSGGVTVNAGTLYLNAGGWYVNPFGQYNVVTLNSGAVLRTAGSHSLGVDQNQINVSGGTLVLGAENYISGLQMTGGTVNGGELRTWGGTMTFNASVAGAVINSPLNLVGGATMSVADGTAAYDLTLAGSVGNGNGLTKTGSGLLLMTANNTYTGPTLVSGGALIVNGTLTTNTVTVQTNATLGGAGTLGGTTAVQLGGTLAPGDNGIGTLTINNTLTLAGRALFEISKTGTNLFNDRASGITTLTCGGSLVVTNIGTNSFASGDTFKLFDATTFTGAFTNFTLPTLASGASWDTSKVAVDGTLTVAGWPIITNQPQSLSVNVGDAASFTVGASGSLPLGYQWCKDGANLPSANASTFNIANATTNDAGAYTVVVTNAFGSVTSAVATLTVNFPPPVVAITSPTVTNANIPSGVGLILEATPTTLRDPVGMTVAWSEVSGPGTVAFGNAAATNTTALFSTNGTYVLQLTATDGPLQSSNTVTVNVAYDPWAGTIVGSSAAGATYGQTNGVFTTTAGGAGLPSSSTPDNFYFIHQQATGDVQITARVVSVANINSTSSRGGVMIRETTNSNARHIFMGVASTSAGRSVYRSAAGGNNTSSTSTTLALPYWVRVTRSVNSFSAYSAPDVSGAPGTWTQRGTTQTIAMNNAVRIGLAATSGSASANGQVVIDKVTITPAQFNTGPFVSAGSDAATTNASVSLNGIFSDDGLPNPPAAVTSQWSQVSGPAGVGFANASASNTTATFPSGGNFVLRLVASDSQVKTFEDMTAAVTDLPSVITHCATNRSLALVSNCTLAAPNLTSEVIATDTFSSVTVTQSPAPGAALSLGPNTVTLYAVDAGGNVSTCQATITVLDQIPPTITCPTNLVVMADLGRCSKSNVLFAPTASDNCTVTNVACAPPSGSTFAIGTTLVTCTARDSSGNSSPCTFTVTVTDTENPQITCPANLTLSADAGRCSKSNVSFVASATDNCSVTNTSCVPPSGSTFAAGVTTVTCTARDASGNSTPCVFTVTVSDTELPQLAGLTALLFSADAGQCGKSNVTFSVTATDNCAVTNVSCAPPSGSTFASGATTVTCTARDSSGNSAQGTFTVTVTDTESPQITCSTNLSFSADSGQCGKSNVTFAATATDNCAVTNTACAPPSGSTFSPGVTLVTCTARDRSGNSAQCTFTVTVTDDENPRIVCPVGLLFTKDSGQTSKSNVIYMANATDNCTVTNAACIPPSGSTFPLGTNLVTCTARDAGGHSAACNFSVVVLSEFLVLTNEAVNVRIPDGSPVGLVSSMEIATPIEVITDIQVTLNVAGGFNGDLLAYLVHDSGHAILLNRVGKTLANPSGYSDAGLNVTFDDSATNGDIHNYRVAFFGNPTTPLPGALTNTWAPDGRDTDPALVLDSDPRSATLSAFTGLNPNGRWTLFIADVDATYSSTLVSWGLQIHGTNAPPLITAQPQSRTNVLTTEAVFSVTAAVLSTPSYQWYLGSTALSGATNATLHLPNVQTNHAGNYLVRITTLGGSVLSEPATLTVIDQTVSGLVEMEFYAGPAGDGVGNRVVTFKGTDATNGPLAAWSLPLNFTNRLAPFTLAHAPLGLAHLSAKTAWHLRTRLPVTFTNSVAVVNFTSANGLRAGDLDNSNTVNLGDYFILAGAWYTSSPAADLDGSGFVDVDDYFLLSNHWLSEGDPE